MINLSEKNMAVLKASVTSDSQPSTELSLICMGNCLELLDEEMDDVMTVLIQNLFHSLQS